jgi:hypothetical protein
LYHMENEGKQFTGAMNVKQNCVAGFLIRYRTNLHF